MPITIPIHPVEPNVLAAGRSKPTVRDMLKGSRRAPLYELEFLNSSFGRDPLGRAVPSSDNQLVRPTANGLIDTAILAYNRHHHLSIRPDDMWICIVTQLSFYINAHAEEMRSQFVSDEGQMRLISVYLGNRFSADWPAFIADFNKQIKANLVDENIHGWLVPAFTTTTETDVIAAGACIMGAIKKYFFSVSLTSCGLPSITIEGVREDWVSIREKLEFFTTFDRKELTKWYNMLVPIIDHFIAAFDGNIDVPNFWGKTIKYLDMESGRPYINGWMSCLAPFSEEGKWQFHSSVGEKLGVVFPRLDISDISVANVEVDIEVNDNGLELSGKLVAGLMGYEWNEGRMQLSPAVGWVMYIHDAEKEKEIYEEKERRLAAWRQKQGDGGATYTTDRGKKYHS